MGIVKDLTTGKLSLELTFWGYGVAGGLMCGVAGMAAIQTSIGAVYFVLFCKFILSAMVLSGITFILRNGKITFWGVIAFLIFLVQTLSMLSFVFFFFKNLLS